jgi:hypothetical protein
MLKPGGYIIFSDMTWSLEESFSCNTRKNRAKYTNEQMTTRHVSLIVDTLARTDKRFKEIHINNYSIRNDDNDESVFEKLHD